MKDKPKNKVVDELLGSNYDGIQEYDNDLPRWWVGLFYLTIIGGVIYAGYVHLAGIPSDMQAVAAQMRALKSSQLANNPGEEPPTEEKLAALLNDPIKIGKGRELYVAKCAACHAQNGEGLVGPNLTDDSWVHGGTNIQIKRTIEQGVPAKGMLAWKGLMSEEDIISVLSYLGSIRNTNLPGKAPEGTKG